MGGAAESSLLMRRGRRHLRRPPRGLRHLICSVYDTFSRGMVEMAGGGRPAVCVTDELLRHHRGHGQEGAGSMWRSQELRGTLQCLREIRQVDIVVVKQDSAPKDAGLSRFGGSSW